MHVRLIRILFCVLFLGTACQTVENIPTENSQPVRIQDELLYTETPLPLPPSNTPLPSATNTDIPATATELPTATATLIPPHILLPDSEIIFTVEDVDFDVDGFVAEAGGFLSEHEQYLSITKWTTGADVLEMVALENGINPRLLLGVLEYVCGCVLGNPGTQESLEPYFGVLPWDSRIDLYGQLFWAVTELERGFYGRLSGNLTEITFRDGSTIPLPPDLNPGTAALHYFFAQIYNGKEWEAALDPETGFPAMYRALFGEAWNREMVLFPEGFVQPPLILPFEAGAVWSFTGGPHVAWEGAGPDAALDFAPAAAVSGCADSDAWVVAVADGTVVRSAFGAVVQDLDEDGLEQTGWNIVYLHLADRDRVPAGTRLRTGDRIGHPSCEGAHATGTHLHLARKYNGAWIPAAGPVPFVLSGWTVFAGANAYEGELVRGEERVIANPFGPDSTIIIRNE